MESPGIGFSVGFCGSCSEGASITLLFHCSVLSEGVPDFLDGYNQERRKFSTLMHFKGTGKLKKGSCYFFDPFFKVFCLSESNVMKKSCFVTRSLSELCRAALRNKSKIQSHPSAQNCGLLVVLKD